MDNTNVINDAIEMVRAAEARADAATLYEAGLVFTLPKTVTVGPLEMAILNLEGEL